MAPAGMLGAALELGYVFHAAVLAAKVPAWLFQMPGLAATPRSP